MEMKFAAQHRVLSLSECERLCSTWSRETEELAHKSGWYGMPGERLEVSIGTAINMMVLSIARNHGVETQAMASRLPGLRNEALLKLGEDTSNWEFQETSEAHKQFWPMLYGSREAVRPRIASLLKCCLCTTTRKLRFHSQSDVECLSNLQVEQGHSDRTPRFTIDAHDLADRIRTTCHGPLFAVKATYAA